MAMKSVLCESRGPGEKRDGLLRLDPHLRGEQDSMQRWGCFFDNKKTPPFTSPLVEGGLFGMEEWFVG